LAGGNFAKMLRVMAGEYSGIGGQCVNAQHANQCKRAALLKAAEVVEENAKLREELEQLKTDRNLRKREDGQ
jgi:hypothetical protein